MKSWFAALPLALAIPALAAAKPPAPATPLFASDAPIRVTIQGPISSLASNRSETPRPASMTVDVARSSRTSRTVDTGIIRR